MFAPDQTKYMYPMQDTPWQSMIDDPEDLDEDRFPLYRKAESIRLVRKPGQTLFCPNGWRHTTRMLSTSIGVVTVSVNAANWARFSTEISRIARQQSFRHRLRSYRVLCAGALLQMLDRVGTRRS